MNNILFKIILFFEAMHHRVRYKKLDKTNISSLSKIGKGFQFLMSRNIHIEDYVYIGPGSFISAFGSVRIKRGTLIGPRVIIHTANHNYKNDIVSIPYDQELLIKDVIIQENVWIGDSVIILPGIVIGEGSIVAAGSVVVKNIPEFSIVGGNPAKVIGQRRNIDEYKKLKSEDKIYLKIKNEKV